MHMSISRNLGSLLSLLMCTKGSTKKNSQPPTLYYLIQITGLGDGGSVISEHISKCM